MSGSLHLIMSADPRAVADCLALARPGDRVLLVDRGVDLLAAWHGLADRDGLCDLEPSALRADVAAAGLGALASGLGIPMCDDAEWVAQVCDSAHVMSWR